MKQAIIALLRRNWRTASAFIALCADVFIIAGCFILVAVLVYPDKDVSEVIASHQNLLFFFIGVFVFLFTAGGLYRVAFYDPLKTHFLQASKSYLVGIAFVLGTLFLAGNLFYPPRFVAAWITVFPFCYLVSWLLLRALFRWFRKLGIGKWNTLVCGEDGEIDSLLDLFEGYPDLGYATVGIVKAPHFSGEKRKLLLSKTVIEQVVKERNVEFLVLTTPEMNGSYDDIEEICRRNFVKMRLYSPESEALFLQTGIHDIAGLPLYSPRRLRIDAAKGFTKRLFDMVGSLLLLLIFSPVLLFVAIATKLESRGPVFFVQKRGMTDRGSTFDFYKFRSMHHTADEQKESLVHRNESTGALFKMKNDPRLTKVGRIIRKLSIDELPQLLNVLKGDMSLVGPRPLPISDFNWLREHDEIGGYYRGRGKVKPGMTGLWQISGRSNLGFREMVMLDLYYVENQSLIYDIEILAKTIPVVVFGKGAY